MDNSEQYIDIIQSEKTFMSQICKHIFTSNNTLSYDEKEIICTNWFIDTLGQCTKKILNPSGAASSAFSLLYQLLNFKRLFKSKSNSIIISSHPHIKIEPQLMTLTDCNHFLIEIAEDYIHLAPKLLLCSEELSYIGTLIRALFGLFFLYIFYRIFKYCAYDNLRKLVWEITSQKEQKILKKLFYEKKEKAIYGQLLRNTIYECQYLKYHNFRPINVIAQQPTLIFKISKQKLLNSLCGYVKSPAIFQGIKDYTISNELATSCELAEEKIRTFVKESDKFRVILEYDIDSDDNDDYDKNNNDCYYNKSICDDDYYFWKRQSNKENRVLTTKDILNIPPSDGNCQKPNISDNQPIASCNNGDSDQVPENTIVSLQYVDDNLSQNKLISDNSVMSLSVRDSMGRMKKYSKKTIIPLCHDADNISRKKKNSKTVIPLCHDADNVSEKKVISKSNIPESTIPLSTLSTDEKSVNSKSTFQSLCTESDFTSREELIFHNIVDDIIKHPSSSQFKSRKQTSSRYKSCYCNLLYKKSSRNILNQRGVIEKFTSCHEVRITKTINEELTNEYLNKLKKETKNCQKTENNTNIFWKVEQPQISLSSISEFSMPVKKNVDIKLSNSRRSQYVVKKKAC